MKKLSSILPIGLAVAALLTAAGCQMGFENCGGGPCNLCACEDPGCNGTPPGSLTACHGNPDCPAGQLCSDLVGPPGTLSSSEGRCSLSCTPDAGQGSCPSGFTCQGFAP